VLIAHTSGWKKWRPQHSWNAHAHKR